jgi:hypothetical protein
MQTSLSPSVFRAFLGCHQTEEAVDEPNLSKKIAIHPAIAGKPLGQYVPHLFRVLSVLEAQYGIVGKTDLVRFPLQAGFNYFLEPFVE